MPLLRAGCVGTRRHDEARTSEHKASVDGPKRTVTAADMFRGSRDFFLAYDLLGSFLVTPEVRAGRAPSPIQACNRLWRRSRDCLVRPDRARHDFGWGRQAMVPQTRGYHESHSPRSLMSSSPDAASTSRTSQRRASSEA